MGGVPGGAVHDGDRGQPAEQGDGAEPVLLRGDVGRDGARLGGQAVPDPPAGELGPVECVSAAGGRGGGLLEPVDLPRAEVAGEVDGVEEGVADRRFVGVVVEDGEQQPEPPAL